MLALFRVEIFGPPKRFDFTWVWSNGRRRRLRWWGNVSDRWMNVIKSNYHYLRTHLVFSTRHATLAPRNSRLEAPLKPRSSPHRIQEKSVKYHVNFHIIFLLTFLISSSVYLLLSQKLNKFFGFIHGAEYWAYRLAWKDGWKLIENRRESGGGGNEQTNIIKKREEKAKYTKIKLTTNLSKIWFLFNLNFKFINKKIMIAQLPSRD